MRSIKSYSKTASKNRIYRANFEAQKILRKLNKNFLVSDLRAVMQEVELKDARYADLSDRNADAAWIAYNYVQWLKRKGFIKRVSNGWEKL